MQAHVERPEADTVLSSSIASLPVFLKSMYVNLMYLSAQRPEEGVEFHGTGVIGHFELPSEDWEPNPSPL